MKTFMLLLALAAGAHAQENQKIIAAAKFINSGSVPSVSECVNLATVNKDDLIRHINGDPPKHSHCSSREAESDHSNYMAMTSATIERAIHSCKAFFASLSGNSTPCGGGLKCNDVAAYARQIGGKVFSACGGDCAVYWTKE